MSGFPGKKGKQGDAGEVLDAPPGRPGRPGTVWFINLNLSNEYDYYNSTNN